MGTRDPGLLPATARINGHFGELLQGIHAGEVVLLTLPCSARGVTATWTAGGPFRITQPDGLLPDNWLAPIFAAALAGQGPQGTLSLSADMAPGSGCGGSTAAIVATAHALGLSGADELAALCNRLEGASDPLMHARPGRLLWAPRRARVIDEMPPLPTLDVIGGTLGPPERTNAEDTRFGAVDDLVATLKAAPDRATLAQVSSTSALRNAALRRPGWLDPLAALVPATGALGLVAAHTGSACGLLFAPGSADSPRVEALLHEAGLRDLISFTTEPAP